MGEENHSVRDVKEPQKKSFFKNTFQGFQELGNI